MLIRILIPCLLLIALSACAHQEKSPTNETAVVAVPKNEVFVTQTFEAPKAKVWKTWTEPKEIKKWWGPHQYSAPLVKNDLKVGGRYLFAMRGPDGKTNYRGGQYTEIIPQKKLVATDHIADDQGKPIPEFPEELLVTVRFEEERDGLTRVTVLQEGIPAAMVPMVTSGWKQSLEKFEKALKSR